MLLLGGVFVFWHHSRLVVRVQRSGWHDRPVDPVKKRGCYRGDGKGQSSGRHRVARTGGARGHGPFDARKRISRSASDLARSRCTEMDRGWKDGLRNIENPEHIGKYGQLSRQEYSFENGLVKQDPGSCKSRADRIAEMSMCVS